MVKRSAYPNPDICVACGVCALECPRGAIQIFRGCYAKVEKELCVGCGICQKACPANAVEMRENLQEVKHGN